MLASHIPPSTFTRNSLHNIQVQDPYGMEDKLRICIQSNIQILNIFNENGVTNVNVYFSNVLYF
jgi:hypothetical protein